MTADAERALEGASYVVTTVRPGDEEGRIRDERIALSHGVLGQETTGPGGFAMALRSIPMILKYAELLKKVSPDAWLFNFTNPCRAGGASSAGRGVSSNDRHLRRRQWRPGGTGAVAQGSQNDVQTEVSGLTTCRSRAAPRSMARRCYSHSSTTTLPRRHLAAHVRSEADPAAAQLDQRVSVLLFLRRKAVEALHKTSGPGVRRSRISTRP